MNPQTKIRKEKKKTIGETDLDLMEKFMSNNFQKMHI